MSIIIGFSRYALPIIAFIVIAKCIMTLLLGHPINKTYGYITDKKSGEQLPLNTWETSIGRSTSCDIALKYDTVSRFQAVISRRPDGWYVFDTRSRSGTKVNGQKIDSRSIINDGDIIEFGSMRFVFSIADDPVQQVGKKKRGKKNSAQPAQKPSQPQKSAPTQQKQTVQSQRPVPPPQNSKPATPPKPADDFSNDKFSLNFEKSKPTAKDKPASKQMYSDSLRRGKTIYADDSSAFGTSPTGTTPKKAEKTAFSTVAEKKTVPVSTPPRTTAKKVKEPAVINIDTGEVFVLCGTRVIIGRGRAADISLSDLSVSRKHAVLTLFEDGWAIDDMNSRSGTTLNASIIKKPQLLFDNDIIGICDYRFKYVENFKNKR